MNSCWWVLALPAHLWLLSCLVWWEGSGLCLLCSLSWLFWHLTLWCMSLVVVAGLRLPAWLGPLGFFLFILILWKGYGMAFLCLIKSWSRMYEYSSCHYQCSDVLCHMSVVVIAEKGSSPGYHHTGVHETGFLKCSNPTALGRALHKICCKSVYITRLWSMKIPVSFCTFHAMADKRILVNSGATDNFIDLHLISHLGLGIHPLEWPQRIWNIDGTNNQAGMLTHYVDLEVRMRAKEEQMCFLVTGLGNEDLILGYPCHVWTPI